MERELSKGKLIVEECGAIGDYAGVEISYISPSGQNLRVGVIEEDNSENEFVVYSRMYVFDNEEPVQMCRRYKVISKMDEFYEMLKKEIREYAEKKGFGEVTNRVLDDICEIYLDCQEWNGDDMVTGFTLEEIGDFLRHSSEVDYLLKNGETSYLVDDLYATLEKAWNIKSKLVEKVLDDDGFDALDSAFADEISKEELLMELLKNEQD